jgi:FkbM family methyltransferase
VVLWHAARPCAQADYNTVVMIAKSIQGARALWTTGRRLGLNPPDRVKYALSCYASRCHPLFARAAPLHFTVQLPGGIKALIRPNGVDHGTLADIFDRRLYELSADGVKRVLDLGANIGAATLFFAARFPQAEFACVEPFPGNLAVLREAIRLNRIRATVFGGAVGTEAGEADLHVDGHPDAFSLTPAEPSTHKLRVRQFSVPELLDALGWNEIDLLKIDIEGYEKTLFRGNNAWLSRVRLIIGEAHEHVGYQIGDVRADLAAFGFQVRLNSCDAKHGLTIFEARNGPASR